MCQSVERAFLADRTANAKVPRHFMPGCTGTKMMPRELVRVCVVVIAVIMKFPTRALLQTVNAGLLSGQRRR